MPGRYDLRTETCIETSLRSIVSDNQSNWMWYLGPSCESSMKSILSPINEGLLKQALYLWRYWKDAVWQGPFYTFHQPESHALSVRQIEQQHAALHSYEQRFKQFTRLKRQKKWLDLPASSLSSCLYPPSRHSLQDLAQAFFSFHCCRDRNSDVSLTLSWADPDLSCPSDLHLFSSSGVRHFAMRSESSHVLLTLSCWYPARWLIGSARSTVGWPELLGLLMIGSCFPLGRYIYIRMIYVCMIYRYIYRRCGLCFEQEKQLYSCDFSCARICGWSRSHVRYIYKCKNANTFTVI